MESLLKMEENGTKYVVKDPTSCPNCEKVAKGHHGIISLFGLRNMGDGTIKVQSWCIECRNKSSREVVA